MKSFLSTTLLVIFLNSFPNLFAQSIREYEKPQLEKQISVMVNDYRAYISTLKNRDISNTVKEECVSNLLKLFINCGEDYGLYDIDFDKRGLERACIETTYAQNTQVASKSVKRYVHSICNQDGETALMQTADRLTSIDIVVVIDSIEQQGRYVYTVLYYADFVKFNNEQHWFNTENNAKKMQIHTNIPWSSKVLFGNISINK